MNLNLGALETNWKFLVLDNLNESVLGEDFIERHYTKSRGITDNKLWLDENVRMVSEPIHQWPILFRYMGFISVAECRLDQEHSNQ